MKSSTNREERATTRHLLSPNEASSIRNGSHLITLLVKGVPWEAPKQPRLCPRLLVPLHKLTARPCC